MSVLGQVLLRGPSRSKRPLGAQARPDGHMSILEHLSALRRALIISLLAWAVASVAAFMVWTRLLEFLTQRGGVGDVYYHTPTGAFSLALKLTLYVGFALAAPVIAQQIWWFVSPGLHRDERRLALPLLLATVLFFAVGVAFALLSLPLFLKVLTGFAPAHVHYFPFVDDYVSFVLVLVLGFGLVFELPVVIYALGRMGIISSRWLYKNRLYWVVGLGILSSLATPGADPITPLLMFIPLYVFWEGATLLLRMSGR